MHEGVSEVIPASEAWMRRALLFSALESGHLLDNLHTWMTVNMVSEGIVPYFIVLDLVILFRIS